MFSQGWEFTTLNITQKFWNKHSDELQKLLSLLKFENWSMHYQQIILNVTTVNLKRLTFCFLLVSWNQLKYLRVWGLYSPNYGGNCCCRQNHHRRDLIRRRSKLPWSITTFEHLGKFHGFQWYFPFSRLFRVDESVEFAFQNSFFH